MQLKTPKGHKSNRSAGKRSNDHLYVENAEKKKKISSKESSKSKESKNSKTSNQSKNRKKIKLNIKINK